MFKIELMVGEGTTVIYIDKEEETWLDEMKDFEDYWLNNNKIEISFKTDDNEDVLIEKTWEMMYNLRNKELNYASIHNIEMIEPEWYIKHIWYNNKDIYDDVYNDDDFIDFEYDGDWTSYELKNILFIETNLLIILRNYRFKELGL
jgi:hypothetical protein